MILFFTNIHDYVEIYVYTLIICNLQPRDIYILLLEIYLLLARYFLCLTASLLLPSIVTHNLENLSLLSLLRTMTRCSSTLAS